MRQFPNFVAKAAQGLMKDRLSGKSRSGRPTRVIVRRGSRRSSYRGKPRRVKRYRKRRIKRRSGAVGRGRLRRRKRTSLGSLMWRKLCTPMTYKATTAGASTGIQGQRSWVQYELGGETFITTLGNKHPSNFLFDTAGGVSSSTATLQDTGGFNYQLCIRKLVHDMRIQNRSNSSMELKMYECVIRHDVPNGSITRTSTGILPFFVDSMDTPTYIGQSLSNIAPGQATYPTGLTHAYQHPAFTPYMSNEFCSFFKIVKTTTMTLDPNEIVQKVFTMRPKNIKGSMINSGASLEWQKGWSKIVLFSWVGMPVDDGTTSNLTKAKTDLFLQDEVTAKFHFMPGMEPLANVSFTNDFNGIGTAYSFNPTGFTPVVPASDTIQVIPGYASTSGTVTATDTAPSAAP